MEDIKRVRSAIKAIENFRSDWLEGHNHTRKTDVSTGVVISKRKNKIHERYLCYTPVAGAEKYHPVVVDTINGHQEALELGDGDNVLRYAFDSDKPQEAGATGLRQMAERLELLAERIRRNHTRGMIDGYSLHTPHRTS